MSSSRRRVATVPACRAHGTRSRDISPKAREVRRHGSRCRTRRHAWTWLSWFATDPLRGLLPDCDRSIGRERCLHLVFSRPPVGPIDLGDAIADDLLRWIDLVEAPRIAAEELSLIGNRQVEFLHRLHRPPSVVAVMVIDV